MLNYPLVSNAHIRHVRKSQPQNFAKAQVVAKVHRHSCLLLGFFMDCIQLTFQRPLLATNPTQQKYAD